MGKLILASTSPRRKEILALSGIPYTVIPSDAEEVITSDDPEEVVRSLSEQKAEAVLKKAEEGDVIIGADTVVSLDNKILGKPKDEKKAFEMLKSIQGRVHTVFTGVTLIQKGHEDEAITFTEQTKVHILPMTDEEIMDYIATGEPMDKAGGYGVQGPFAVYTGRIEGDYLNVVGLPLARLYGYLKKYREELI